MSDKTCDNCNHRPGSCMDRDVFSDENGDCKSWQPIPVATTDAPEPDKLGKLPAWYREQEYKNAIDAYQKTVVRLREAIAKRDDLIRRMADALNGCYLTDYIDDTAFDLMAEVNELMGVK